MPLSRSSAAGHARLRPTVAVAAALVLSALTLASCASHRSSGRNTPPPAAKPSAFVPVETRIGVVRAIGPEQRFVLIETPSATATSTLSEGQILHCRPPDAPNRVSTADLRVSREHHQTLLVANVVAGEPVVGAVVYFTPGTPPAAAPPAGSISSVATAPLPGLSTPRKP